MANKDEIIRILADKYNQPKDEVEKAVDSQFEFASQEMPKPDMPQVRLPFFGVFKPNMKKVKKINEIKKQNNNNNE